MSMVAAVAGDGGRLPAAGRRALSVVGRLSSHQPLPQPDEVSLRQGLAALALDRAGRYAVVMLGTEVIEHNIWGVQKKKKLNNN